MTAYDVAPWVAIAVITLTIGRTCIGFLPGSASAWVASLVGVPLYELFMGFCGLS